MARSTKTGSASISTPSKHDLIRQAAENDLLLFIRLVAPHRVLGAVHEDLVKWWTKPDSKSHQLTLLPRDHQKSAMLAYRVAWWITKHPDATFLYISSTANLAEKQLGAIKAILTSKVYRRYWPEMVHPEEGKRTKWTNSEIAVDHPKRIAEGVRDPTVFTGGLTTSLTGLHCDVAVLDDVVVYENAYTEEGRNKCMSQYSLLSSIESANALEWVVGTRYHPKDLYQHMTEMEREVYDPKTGELIGAEEVYEVFSREVEDMGDGTGEFLWPRQMRHDGKWFGFDSNILSKKKAQYLDKSQFYAQYYNNPNMHDGTGVDTSRFQYYNKDRLVLKGGKWYYNGEVLNVYAAMDFAFSVSSKADYTAIVVIGIDANGNIYVLDIDRFRTGRIRDYFERVKRMHVHWNFRKLRAEVSIAQDVIVRELKDYIRQDGLSLSIDPHRPTRHTGTKEERMRAILEPRYDNMSVWHYRGGNCQTLEEELSMAKPPHDDIKDALASAVEIATPPRSARANSQWADYGANVIGHSRFGGVRY
jgi:phage terminase large subunit-like protein